MSLFENYLDQTFVVSDPDARIRKAGDLRTFLTYKASDTIPAGRKVGDFKLIPKNAKVTVDKIQLEPSSSKSRTVYAHATAADGSQVFGWTSTINFKDRFRNITLGQIDPKPGANRYSDTAAWSGGKFIRQNSLIWIVDISRDIERLTEPMVQPYLDMVAAAKKDKMSIYISSGFRSYHEQKALRHRYDTVPGAALAAKPGFSKHQNGTALDIPVSNSTKSDRYLWLAENATLHGYLRTVKSEPWHWEYLPDEADAARKRGSHTRWD